MSNFHETMRAGSHTDRITNWLVSGWYGQHTNPVRAERRAAVKAAGGIRALKKARRAARLS